VKNFKSVLAFGDSHVAGCELAGYGGLDDYLNGKMSLEELDAPGKEFAFPKIVADKLNIPCYNYAMSGGSNARSLRLLTQAVQDHPNSLVLFGYTCTDRTEFYYPDNGNFIGRDKDNFIQAGMQWQGFNMGHPVNDHYLEILRPYNNLNQLAFIVDNICSMWAIDFLHLPLFQEELHEVENLFNFEGHRNYLNWCEANNFKKLPYQHYDHDAHSRLAKLILEQL
jgi:hypothetical protein